MAILFDYRCTKCENIFEDIKATDDDRDSSVCPLCGSSAERIISAVSGWMTDVDSVKEKINKDVNEINKQIKKGNEKVIENIRGPGNKISKR